MAKLCSLASVPTMSVGRPTPSPSSTRTRSRQSMEVWAAHMTATTTRTKLKSGCAQNGQMPSSSERPYYRSFWYATLFHVSICSPTRPLVCATYAKCFPLSSMFYIYLLVHYYVSYAEYMPMSRFPRLYVCFSVQHMRNFVICFRLSVCLSGCLLLCELYAK